MELADWIGFAGVGMLLLAFLLNLLKKIERDGFPYIAMNLVGAALACTASVMIDYMPFIILEGAWTVVSFVMIVNLLARRTA